MVSIDKIKQLRKATGVSPVECKKALQDSKGDFKKAKELLRKWGKEIVDKKKERGLGAGLIEIYVHPNKKVGVMIDLRSESDFVVKSENFQKLAHELCLQIAAMNPLFISEENIPQKLLEKEKEIYQEQLKNSGKSQEIIKKIVDGKLKSYKKEKSLMSQPWIKDSKRTIKELMDEHIVKLGENIVIERYERYEI